MITAITEGNDVLMIAGKSKVVRESSTGKAVLSTLRQGLAKRWKAPGTVGGAGEPA